MELILSKPVVVALAVLGAGISMLASFLQTRNRISAAAARGLNYAGTLSWPPACCCSRSPGFGADRGYAYIAR